MSFPLSRNALLLLGLPLAFSACANTPDADNQLPPEFGISGNNDLFQTGSEEEMVTAEDLGWQHMGVMMPRLGITADDVEVSRVQIDELGMAHTRFQQKFHGVPVFGGEAIVHMHGNGTIRGLSNGLIADLSVDTTPDYTADEAADIATSVSVDWDKLTDDPAVDLWVLRHDGADHLVWRVQLRQIDGSHDTTMPVLFIDAHSGKVVWQYDNLQTSGAATGSGSAYYDGTVSINTYLSGTTYYLEDTTRKLGTYTWSTGTTKETSLTDTDNAWTASTQKIAVEAHLDSAKVWDFYYYSFGRNGIDGVGGPGYKTSVTGSGKVITSGVSYSRKYANAFWDGNQMTYGDGDGTTLGPLTTLDIAGHEMTHGVTEKTAGLVYSGESGGLNESMSDIMGCSVEAYNDGAVSTNTWLVGEDAYTPSTSGDALRYMNDPAKDGYSLDYYSSSAASTDVHYSSGISNLAFYLLAAGGTHPRAKSTTVVTGIGISEADAIFYRALTTYMTSSTNFAAARTATLSAASDLYGASSTEYTQVGNAWSAVGVGATSSGGGGTTSTCSSSYTYSNSGTLSAAGAYNYEPSGSYYYSSTSGSHVAAMTGASGTDFDLYLLKYNSSRGTWSTVKTSGGTTSTESITYSGTAGYYMYEVYDYSGSGTYLLCSNRPS